jgi:hypothetical protein
MQRDILPFRQSSGKADGFVRDFTFGRKAKRRPHPAALLFDENGVMNGKTIAVFKRMFDT